MGRYLSETPPRARTPVSRRWWAFPDEEDGAEPIPARILIGTATGLATTVIGFLVPQALLIAIAFGTADYPSGRPGLGGFWFTLLSAMITGTAGGAGAFVAGRALRRAELGQRDCFRVAALPPGLVVAGIVISGLADGSGWGGALLVAGLAGPAVAVTARSGSR